MKDLCRNPVKHKKKYMTSEDFFYKKNMINSKKKKNASFN